MYLSRLQIQNWRSYGNSTFNFKPPTDRRPVVLIGAMNGHGKTSFLISLYLGLFGRFGLRYCEGFRGIAEDDAISYRKALGKYRRNSAAPEEPTIIDITFTPTLNDTDEDEVRIVRRWHFTGANQPKQGDAFEEVEIYVGDKVVRRSDLVTAHSRIERHLFPAHVTPAFFFDGEQAQALIENTGEVGIKKAVEVMFGTKVIEEVADTLSRYLVTVRQSAGGVKKGKERQEELDNKLDFRKELNDRIAKLQGDHVQLDNEKEDRERERRQLTEDLARMGGAGARDAASIQAEYVKAEQARTEAERRLAEVVRSLGLALSVARLGLPIRNRLKAEETLESWEGLKRGTLDNKEKVLAAALPEPSYDDPILGHLESDARTQLRERFSLALERIYNPPPPNCAAEYLLGHVKGEIRSKALLQLDHIQEGSSARIRLAAKCVRDTREAFDEVSARKERLQNLPQETKEMSDRLDKLNQQVAEAIRRLGGLENEVKALKAQLHDVNAEIGRIQDELARLEPEQKRIAVAEKVNRVLEELQEALKPTTSNRLEECVSGHFLKIADKRYRGGIIRLPAGYPPEIQFSNGDPRSLLEMFSGFEKRSFGIAFSLALAEITKRRIPLVIDTPLGNADSEYRPRTLKALTDIDLDQIIILTHDQEVTPDLHAQIKGFVCQRFLVEFNETKKISMVQPDKFFS